MFRKELIGGIPVTRTWIYASPVKSFWRRVLNYGSFAVSSLIGGLSIGRSDVIYCVIENKLDNDEAVAVAGTAEMPGDNGVLRIGYFGLLRCSRSLEILRQASEKGDGRVHVYVRGVLIYPNLAGNEESTSDHFEYGGPYVSPDDLRSIYERVDMVWAAYPYEGSDVGNWKWARTHRYYESCFFGKPMFTGRGTEDGRVADGLDIGMSLDLSDTGGSVDRILAIEASDFERWKSNICKIPRHAYVNTDEHHLLLERMKTLCCLS